MSCSVCCSCAACAPTGGALGERAPGVGGACNCLSAAPAIGVLLSLSLPVFPAPLSNCSSPTPPPLPQAAQRGHVVCGGRAWPPVCGAAAAGAERGAGRQQPHHPPHLCAVAGRGPGAGAGAAGGRVRHGWQAAQRGAGAGAGAGGARRGRVAAERRLRLGVLGMGRVHRGWAMRAQLRTSRLQVITCDGCHWLGLSRPARRLLHRPTPTPTPRPPGARCGGAH